MSAFAPAIEALFTDPMVSEAATYMVRGVTPPVSLRVIRRMPDGVADFGGARLVQPALTVDIRIVDAPLAAKDDRLTIGGVTYVVQAAPVRDREGLTWSLDLRPA
jgi:hypothetical protein